LAVQDLTPEQRKQLDMKGGVVVGGVGGPAAKAGKTSLAPAYSINSE